MLHFNFSLTALPVRHPYMEHGLRKTFIERVGCESGPGVEPEPIWYSHKKIETILQLT